MCRFYFTFFFHFKGHSRLLLKFLGLTKSPICSQVLSLYDELKKKTKELHVVSVVETILT